MTTNILFIGDPHFMVSNIPEVELFMEKMLELAKEKQPDIIIVGGDLLHTHERLHVTPLNKAYEFVDKLRKISLTYVLVGNHDMCLGKDTHIIMWDGSIKMCQNIVCGDILIGDDGKPRKVKNIVSGKSKLYEIEQMEADNYIVNENHILSLKCGFHKSIFWNKTKLAWTVKWIDTKEWKLKSKFFSLNYRVKEKKYIDYETRTVEKAKEDAMNFLTRVEDLNNIDIPLSKYLKLPKNIKDRMYGYRLDKTVRWKHKDVNISPYILGSWLGDGSKDGSGICGADIDVIVEWCNWALEIGASIAHSGQYNYSIRNDNYKIKGGYKKDIISGNTKECKACINHIKVYKRAPSLMCASLKEIQKLIDNDKEVTDYFSNGSSKEQLLFLNNKDKLFEFQEWKKMMMLNVKNNSGHFKSPLRKLLKTYNLYNNKHIPEEYLVNSQDVRLQLLAGFIDTDGSVVSGRNILISQGGENIHLIDELKKLVLSLGFKCKTSKIIKLKGGFYKKDIFISGNIEKIPTRILRKKCIKIMNSGIDSRGRKCADKSRTKIKVKEVEYGKYFGFEVDGNNRFLLGDFTVVHNCNNQQYLTTNHWMNGMKEWNNTVIVDKVIEQTINDTLFIFVPYVYTGRFREALDTIGSKWKDASCIFAHQEFFGCKMGAIISVEGDKWPLDYPHIVSGHIHSNQTPQENVYYPGSAMQHAFGESSKNIIAYLSFESNEKYKLEEFNLNLPRKKIVYVDIENIDDYKLPETEDKIKITITGSYEEFKALKKTKKYKKMIKDGTKIVFKPKKIKEKVGIEELVGDNTNFENILKKLVDEKKNNYLHQSYELVINNKNVDVEDIIYL